MPGKQEHGRRQRQHAGDNRHQHRNATKIGQNQVFTVFKRAIRAEAGKGQLHNAGKDQTDGDKVGHRDLKLCHRGIRHHHTQTEDTDNQNTDNRQHPGAGANYTGIGIGPDQAKQGVLAQQSTQFKTNAGH